MNEEFVIKIYLPKGESGEYLYGEVAVENKVIEHENRSKTVENVYVIKRSTRIIQQTKLELVGTLSKTSQHERGINITVDDSDRVLKLLRDGKELKTKQQVLVIYYEKDSFLRSYDVVQSSSVSENNFALTLARALKTEDELENGHSTFSKIVNKSEKILITTTTFAGKVLRVVSPAFQNTVIHRHCNNWQKCLTDKRSMKGFFLLDVMLGIMFFLLMNHVQHSGQYFMDLTELIVNKLRRLLETLDGSPAGLKLNVQLNNFLLSCFVYHVDLWWNFIVIVEPAIHYLFFPITMFGLMGFSFQCAMLCDVITLITLHAHCFYIYAAMLYKLELSSIRSLLRIVLGRRLNVLKSESKLCMQSNRENATIYVYFQTALSRRITQIVSCS